MARPKVAVAEGPEKGKAPQNHDDDPTVLEMMKFRKRMPEGRGGKKSVKLEDGTVVHMRAKKETTMPATMSQGGLSGVEDLLHDVNIEGPSPVVGGGSSSANLESAEGSRFLSRDYKMHCTMNEEGKLHARGIFYFCTACGCRVAVFEMRAHPVLHVGVCGVCFDFLFSSPFTKDNPSEHENECRWCGDGGEVILCDTCPKAFCKPCIQRNFKPEFLHAIESPLQQWSCFVCDDQHLQDLIKTFADVKRLVKSLDRGGQPPKNGPRRDSNSGKRTRGLHRGLQVDNSQDTIATIIARQKASLLRKYPEKAFSGFDRPKHPRQPKYRRHFVGHRQAQPEHAPSNEESAPISEQRPSPSQGNSIAMHNLPVKQEVE